MYSIGEKWLGPFLPEGKKVNKYTYWGRPRPAWGGAAPWKFEGLTNPAQIRLSPLLPSPRARVWDMVKTWKWRAYLVNCPEWRAIKCFLPWNHDDKVHDVPGVSQVAALVQDEAVGENLHHHFHREDAHEHRLQFFLQSQREQNNKYSKGPERCKQLVLVLYWPGVDILYILARARPFLHLAYCWANIHNATRTCSTTMSV